MKLRTFAAYFVALLFAVSNAATAQNWSLVPDQSRISFVSVKAETIGEVHHFTDIEGNITASGDVLIAIPLESVETLIDIRNERMREFLFETVTFPTATITASLNPENYSDMPPGSRSLATISARLDLHGVTSELEFDVFVTRISDNSVTVDTAAPIILDADEFELGSGLNKLRELASLDDISPIVPVTVSLLFNR